jgi:hypothetical protein
MVIALPGAAYQRAPATCLVVALRRLKRLVVAIMRMTVARPLWLKILYLNFRLFLLRHIASPCV